MSAVTLHAFTCGELTIPHGFLIAGAKGKLRVPVPSYLITHPRGRVLLDSGLSLATQHDAAAHMGERGMRGTAFHFGAGEEIGARESLERLALPGVLFDRDAALASLRMLAARAAGGARVMFSHDPAFWRSVPQAPARLA
jgi:hypothetical protein